MNLTPKRVLLGVHPQVELSTGGPCLVVEKTCLVSCL